MDLNKKLTKNFKLKEFVVSKFYDKESQEKVIEALTPEVLDNIEALSKELQVLRDEVKEPIKINIAFRPLFWELKQGRSGNSQHSLGKAADIRIEGLLPKQVQYTINKLIKEGKMHNGGLGSYSSFTHYDVRPNAARWRG